MKSTAPLKRARRTARATPSATEAVVDKADCGYMGSTTSRVQPASFKSLTACLSEGSP